MKLAPFTILPLLCLLLLTSMEARAVNSAESTVKLDEKGTGELSISFTYDAPSWQRWKQSKTEPDMIWRNIRSSYAAYIIDDFSVKDDDVKRTSTINIKSRCESDYRGDGEFIYKLEKDIKLISDGGGKHWSFSSEINSPLGEPVNHTQHIILPSNADDARLASGSAGQELRYTIPKPKEEVAFREREKSPLFLWLGSGLAALGLVLLPLSFLGGSRPQNPPYQPPPYGPRPQAPQPHAPQQPAAPAPPRQVETPTSGYEP